MKTACYIVSSSGPESYDPTILSGPEVPDWKAYCASIAPQVMAMTVKRCSKGSKNTYGNVNSFRQTVREDDYKEALVQYLTTKAGYKIIKLPEVVVGWGGMPGERDLLNFSVDGVPMEALNPIRVHNVKEYIEDHQHELKEKWTKEKQKYIPTREKWEEHRAWHRERIEKGKKILAQLEAGTYVVPKEEEKP